MGFAHNNTQFKLHHEPSPEIKKPNVSIDPSFIDLENSFLDSLLNFDGWLEYTPLLDNMNSEENPNSEILKIKKEEEEVLDSLVEEGLGRVCLTSAAGDEIGIGDDLKEETSNLEIVTAGVKIDNEIEVMNDTEKGEDDGELEDSEDKSSSSSSASSSSSSSDDDEDDESHGKPLKKEKGEVEMEEGEIREEMLVLSDDEDEDDIVKGPIRSRNEVQDLPPVPPVTVTIQPHHQTLPVGVVLSMMGSQVIVEGVENHNPLSEGSILWITESRSPLGVVDEIFGPVKNPYYIVRYNSEDEIPSGIQQGSSISFVPEFADYVLNNNNLYKKGYDASGENDEELSEELEFSDDEKEAEYKRMLKMSKRGSSGDKNGGMKKDKKSRNRGGNRKNDHQPSVNLQVNTGGPPNGPPSGLANGPPSGPANGPPTFLQAPNIAPSGGQPFGFPPFQPQNLGFPPNGFPPYMQQPNFMQQPFQNLGGPNLAQFDPRFNGAPGPMFSCNFVPPNFGAFGSWPSGIPQNNFNQQQAAPPMVFQQGVAGPNNGGFAAAGNGEASQNRGGRRPFQRGGGRFRGGGRNGSRPG